jgi:hypothetical protein
MRKSRFCFVTVILLSVALLLGAASVVIAQTNLVTNGDFEGGFASVANSDPLDAASTPDGIPNGWTGYETFSGNVSEISFLNPGAAGDNGPSLPGGSSVEHTRLEPVPATLSGDWTAIYQDLDIDASDCSALTLNMDVKVNLHNLEAGGWVAPAFEWPVIVQISYTTTGGGTQVWRHGWYLYQPGDPNQPGDSVSGPIDDPGTGLIPIFNDEQVTQGVWDANSFNLLAELPQVDTINRIYVGGSGWNFEGQVDNVEIICTPRVPPGIPTLSQWGIIALIIALGTSVLLVLRRKTGSSRV